MKIEFNQGVPKGCIEWLWANVGQGNVYPGRSGMGTVMGKIVAPCDFDAWIYERVFIENPGPLRGIRGEGRSVPTITIKDPELGTLFALRWA